MGDDWTELYRPKSLKDVVGNPKAVKELRDWAMSWEKGKPTDKAVVLKGPPGIGKTSTALALARDMGWGVVEMNASDHRNADSIQKIAIRGAVGEPSATPVSSFRQRREGISSSSWTKRTTSLAGRTTAAFRRSPS